LAKTKYGALQGSKLLVSCGAITSAFKTLAVVTFTFMLLQTLSSKQLTRKKEYGELLF